MSGSPACTSSLSLTQSLTTLPDTRGATVVLIVTDERKIHRIFREAPAGIQRLKGASYGGCVTAQDTLHVIPPDRYFAVDRGLREQVGLGLVALPSALFNLNARHHLFGFCFSAS
jgi:hypothetical protein